MIPRSNFRISSRSIPVSSAMYQVEIPTRARPARARLELKTSCIVMNSLSHLLIDFHQDLYFSLARLAKLPQALVYYIVHVNNRANKLTNIEFARPHKFDRFGMHVVITDG